MKKSTKQFFQKSLCGILTVAMLLSGLAIPELTAYAAMTDADSNTEITEQTTEPSSNVTVPSDGLEQTPGQSDDESDDDEPDTNEEDVNEPDTSEDSTNLPGGGIGDNTTTPEEDTDEEDSSLVETEETEEPEDTDEKLPKEVPTNKTVNADTVAVTGDNLLQNSNFETGTADPWVITVTTGTAADASVTNKNNNDHTGGSNNKYSLHFYSDNAISFTAEQTVKNLEAGTYVFGGYAIGEDKADGAKEQLAYVDVYGSDGTKKGDRKTTAFSMPGWGDGTWKNPEVTGIEITAGDYLVVGVSIQGEAASWADIDDLYLYAYTPTQETKTYQKTISLNYYHGALDANAAEELGFYYWKTGDKGITALGTNNTLISGWGGWEKPDQNPVYTLTAVEDHSGWFNIEYTVDEEITLEDSVPTGSKSGFSIFSSKDKNNPVVNNVSGYPDDVTEDGTTKHYSDIYVGLLEGTYTAIRVNADGELVAHASIEEADEAIKAEQPETPADDKVWTFEELTALIAEADKCKEEDYTVASWKAFATALKEAKAITSTATEAEVTAAYEKLGIAKNTLAAGSISVAKIALSEDFITGADLSSYYAISQSGVVFKDEEGNALDDAGFFKYLKDGGTNWVRIRVWNDPFDSNKKGYGGGNNDINAAKEIGKLATAAGMRVLIDFHYSDFWADPGKQKEPKAWTGYTLDQKVSAIEEYTKTSLQTLKDAGVDVGMVQVGNETTNSICGVTLSDWSKSSQIFNAGSKAVREVFPEALVAIHFTNPEREDNYANFAKNLDTYKVDYDVFASSYYPFWHGTLENLTTLLTNIATTYDKKVMVAETSWATTLADQDGHDDTVRKGSNDKNTDYGYSVQGQADEMRAVIKAVNDVNETAAGKGIGVFYWEPAWMSKNYVYKANGSVNQELLNENMSLWEEYGSGWAASYSAEYDPTDAGKWYGGSAIDNQSWFDFFNNALPTAQAYKYIRTGETAAEIAITGVTNPTVTVETGEEVPYPTEVEVSFNDASKASYPVSWRAAEQAAVDTSVAGEYTVNGTVTCEYTLNNGTQKTERKDVVLTIKVKQQVGENLLSNPGFENGNTSSWTVTKSDGAVGSAAASNDRNNAHSGKWSLHFWNTGIVGFTATQQVKNIQPGTYTFGGYAIGADMTDNADQIAFVDVYDSTGNLKGTRKTATFKLVNYDAGWQNPEITDIEVAEGDYLEVGIIIETAANEGGAWGDMDDFYLYGVYDIGVGTIEEGTGSVNVSRARSVSGKTIDIAAAPGSGYQLDKLTISSAAIKAATGENMLAQSATATVEQVDGSVTLTYPAGTKDAQKESFKMPNGAVVVSATFTATGDPIDKTALDALIAECDTLEQGDCDDTAWQTFTTALAAAKAASENGEATQRDVNVAMAALQTACTGVKRVNAQAALNKLITEYEKVKKGNYTDESWDDFQDALTIARITANKADATPEELEARKAALEQAYQALTTNTPDGLWAEWTEDWAEQFTDVDGKSTISYTGSAIKPTVKVYDGERELTLKKDYTVTYTNNKAVGTTAKPEATVKITGKGNYTSAATLNFTIVKKDLGDKDVDIPDLYATTLKNGKQVTPNPVVKIGKTKLKKKTDYTVDYVDTAETAGITPGTHRVKITGAGKNYTGEKFINLILADRSTQVLMSKVSITLNPKTMPYTGQQLKPEVTVKQGKNNTLEEGTDYTLSYGENTKIGTGTVTVTGVVGGKYVGEKTATFKITGTALQANRITLDAPKAGYVYSGEEYKPNVTVKVKVKNVESTLDPTTDYTVDYSNNTNVTNKATVTITGKGAYSGTVKKTFKITAYDISKNEGALFTCVGDNAEQTKRNYTKGGCKPTNVDARFKNNYLEQGTDYTLSYANNKVLSAKAKANKPATITIKGKGNYKGSKKVTFEIVQQDINALKDNITATDILVTNAVKKNKYKVIPVILDTDGKKLANKTDFTVDSYTKKKDGVKITDADKNYQALEAGDEVIIAISAKENGNYTGTTSTTYKVLAVNHDVSKATVTVTPQTYTGEAIEPTGGENGAVTVTMKYKVSGKQVVDTLYEGIDYKIISYSNNTNKGNKAKLTIKGIGNYGGTKTQTFKINAKGMSWADAVAQAATWLKEVFN
ncbi:MAG: glycosyl hydrolase 53 family protein [Muribaculaceae bacterium]|nr:glycosyl hydrolase 53 family protein [Muribaculaceae bacterium]